MKHVHKTTDKNGIHQKDGTTVLDHVRAAAQGETFIVSAKQLPVYRESAAAQGRTDLVFQLA